MRVEPIHNWVAGIEIRPNICTEVGDRIGVHLHDHPHLTMVTKGRWLVSLDHKRIVLASSALGLGNFHEWLEVGAGIAHDAEVLELEDGVAAFLCLWSGGIK